VQAEAGRGEPGSAETPAATDRVIADRPSLTGPADIADKPSGEDASTGDGAALSADRASLRVIAE
jgi:hypothetical protein